MTDVMLETPGRSPRGGSPIVYDRSAGHWFDGRRLPDPPMRRAPLGGIEERDVIVALRYDEEKRRAAGRIRAWSTSSATFLAPDPKDQLSVAEATAVSAGLIRIVMALAGGFSMLCLTAVLWRFDLGVTGSLAGLGVVGLTLTASSLGFLFEVARKLRSQ